MNLKKIIVNSFVICSMASALLATGLSANAATVSKTLSVSGFYSYTNNWKGDKSSIYAYTDMTGITTSNSDYYGAYKWVRYAVYGKSNNSYNLIYYNEDSGTDRTILTSPRTITTDVVRRIHKAKLHYSSNSSSNVVDNFVVRLDKS